MGTFHHDKGELHGITVVVTTRAGAVWVGRCDTVDDAGAHLLDADRSDPAADAVAHARWLSSAARYGVWPRHRAALVPAADVLDIRRLSDLRGA